MTTEHALKPGWKLVKFGDVVRNANLTERDPFEVGPHRIVGLEHLDPENLHIRRWNMPEDGTSFTRKFVAGQTLFGKRRAYQRKVAFAEFNGICSSDILTFETKDPNVLLPELLPFICQTDAFFNYALGTSAGSLSPRTSWNALKQFEFPLPPLAEQQRLAELLWAADEAIEKYHVVYQDVDKLLVSIRDHEICNENHQRIELGKVIATIVAGKSVNGVNTVAEANEKGVLKVSAVGPNGFVPDENKRLLDESEFLPQFAVKSGSLLITRCNTTELVGRVCLTENDFSNLMLSDKTLEIKLDERKANKLFIFEALKSSYLRKQIMGCATGTGGAMKNISQQDIRSLTIPLPLVEEQNQIIRRVREVHNRQQQISRTITNLKKVLNTLMLDR